MATGIANQLSTVVNAYIPQSYADQNQALEDRKKGLKDKQKEISSKKETLEARKSELESQREKELTVLPIGNLFSIAILKILR